LVHVTDACDFIDKILAMPAMPKPTLLKYDPEPPYALVTPAGGDLSDMIQPRALVHCQMGISWSVTVVVAYLTRATGRPLEDLLGEVKEKRKVKPNPNFMERLKVRGGVGYRIWEDEEGTVPKEPLHTGSIWRAGRPG
jgi:dual specificity phosphatase 12